MLMYTLITRSKLDDISWSIIYDSTAILVSMNEKSMSGQRLVLLLNDVLKMTSVDLL